MTSERSGRSASASVAGSQQAELSLMGGVAKHSFVYGLGEILARGVSFLMLPVYTRFLTPADYGVMALIDLTLNVVTILAGSSLAVGLFRFYHKDTDEQSRRQLVFTCFALVGLLYTTAGILVFVAAKPLATALFGSTEHTILIRLAATDIAARSLMIVPLGLARLKDQSSFYVASSVARLVLVIGLNIVFLVVLGLGVLGVFLAGLISNALVGTLLAVWLLRTSGFGWSREWRLRLVAYGVPLIGSELGSFLYTFSDRYFLQAAADEAAVGLYNFAYQFGFLLVWIGFTPIWTVWGPKRFQVVDDPERDLLLTRGLMMTTVLMLSTAVGIALYVSDALRIVATPEFYPAAQYVPLLLAAYVLQSWGHCLDIGIHVKEKTRYHAVANAIAAVVAVAGYAIFIPMYLAWAAAAVTVVSFGVRCVLMYVFSQRLWPVSYRWGPIVALSAWATTIILVGYRLPPMDLFPSLAIRTGLVVVYFAGLWFFPILDASERSGILSYLRAGVVRWAGSATFRSKSSSDSP